MFESHEDFSIPRIDDESEVLGDRGHCALFVLLDADYYVARRWAGSGKPKR